MRGLTCQLGPYTPCCCSTDRCASGLGRGGGGCDSCSALLARYGASSVSWSNTDAGSHLGFQDTNSSSLSWLSAVPWRQHLQTRGSSSLSSLLLLLQEQPDRAHKATLPTGVLQDPKGAKLETKTRYETTALGGGKAARPQNQLEARQVQPSSSASDSCDRAASSSTGSLPAATAFIASTPLSALNLRLYALLR